MFWFRNMQEITGVVDRREIRHICSIWTKCFDQCLLKRFLGYWNKHYEVVHGLSRREMHQLFYILTKGLIEGPYAYGVLCQSAKTAHSCSYNLCQQTQDYIAGWDAILLVV